MPFDQQPGEGGGGGRHDPQAEAAKLVGALVIGSLLAAQGFLCGTHWAVDVDTGQFVIARGDHDGLAIPMESIQGAVEVTRHLVECVTGRTSTMSIDFTDPPTIN